MSGIYVSIVVFYIFLSLQLRLSIAQNNLIRVGYYAYASEFPVSNINFSLFTHLICSAVAVNSTSYQLSLSPAVEQYISNFTLTVKQKNPSVITLLSVRGKEANYSHSFQGQDSNQDANYSIFSSMVSNSSHRKSFIDSSIKIARLYNFEGLDFDWHYPSTSSDMFHMGVLFQEWRAAIGLEAGDSRQSELILTARVKYSPSLSSATYPVEAIQRHLNWVHVASQVYTQPASSNLTGAHAAVYNPSSFANTNFGLREWIDGGLSANKLVLTLPFFGFAWTLENPKENGIGAQAKGPAIKIPDGQVSYSEIKNYIKQYGPEVHVRYNSTYVVNYWTKGPIWIGFDDVEAIRAKVSYAKEKKLLGYLVWQVSDDVNWVLSKTASGSSVQEDNKNGQNNMRPFLVILLSTAAAIALLLGVFVIFYCWRRNLKFKAGMVEYSTTESNDIANIAESAGDFYSNDPNLIEYTLADIEAATDGFSIENKLGQGGYGPVYKGILPDGQVIAAKKLSRTSTQGFEEFKNEVVLTAKLQHVNLIRVLGFCIDKEEQILIYEYMPNKSLDSYLFDPIRRYILNWKKRVHIIEGVIQGLLYLQEYSRLTIIHRDLKPSNVLLDGQMKPKISDFGMARIFAKDDLEANTSRIVGTIGYAPPEYIQKGIYSTKSDVYSFGVLLLQIISGKSVSLLYGPNESLGLPNYAYKLYNDGKGMKFMDGSLDDTHSSCKLMRCLKIALLCVQENPVDRPSILEVFTMLKNENTYMMNPKKPAFTKQNKKNKSTRQLEGYSGNTSSISNVPVSDVLAR